MKKAELKATLIDIAKSYSENYDIYDDSIIISFKNNIELRYTYDKDLIVNTINDETTKYLQSHGFNAKAIEEISVNEYNNLVIKGKNFLSIITI